MQEKWWGCGEEPLHPGCGVGECSAALQLPGELLSLEYQHTEVRQKGRFLNVVS